MPSTPHINFQPTTSSKIISLCKQDLQSQALSLFQSFSLLDSPTTHHLQTYSALFQACANLKFPLFGAALHKRWLFLSINDLIVSNHLINMYARCGLLRTARKVFEKMPKRNIVSWTSLISGYDHAFMHHDSLNLFSLMYRQCDEKPNEFTLGSVLSSISALKNAYFGRQVHGLAIKISLDAHVCVGNALVTMYSRCQNALDNAMMVFWTMGCQNLVSWNSMIGACVWNGCDVGAIELFSRMRKCGVGCDRATMVSVLTSCSVLESVWIVQQLHCLSVKGGFMEEAEVATTVMKAYASHGCTEESYRLFFGIPSMDIMCWTGIITTLADQDPEEALRLFQQLYIHFQPDSFTYSAALKACTTIANIGHAQAVHAQVIKAGLDYNVALNNALIHTYARGGNINFAKHAFSLMQTRDTISYNSMIKAYALHGQGAEALSLFEQMVGNGIRPDEITFVGLLSACSHAGMVNEGCCVFEDMVKTYNISRQLNHYACMVDILGRAGLVREAVTLIEEMPFKADSVIWSSLLGACRVHRDAQIGESVAKKLIELKPQCSMGYVLMCNIYAEGGSWSESASLRKKMSFVGVKKEIGVSWIEVGHRVHWFTSGDTGHPQWEGIRVELERVVARIKEAGYLPNTSVVLYEEGEEHKEERVLRHSEKLAMAFGLMFTREGVELRIMKNLRICVDCHNAFKVASGCFGREMVVRDANRFHHFKDGFCSCRDYW
ncbi:hypothetical protein AMTRI_Chr11g150950 [Amborella trichopoda]